MTRKLTATDLATYLRSAESFQRWDDTGHDLLTALAELASDDACELRDDLPRIETPDRLVSWLVDRPGVTVAAFIGPFAFRYYLIELFARAFAGQTFDATQLADLVLKRFAVSSCRSNPPYTTDLR